jgi:MFS family permease
MKPIFVLAIAVAFLFCGLDGGQHFLVPALRLKGAEQLALTSFVVLYLAFFLASFVAPRVLMRLGPKSAIILGAATYPLFLLAATTTSVFLLLLSSAFTGIGAALLWNAISVLVDNYSKSDAIGKESSKVYGSVYVGGLIGAAIGAWLLPRVASSSLFLLYSAISAIGVVAFCFLPPVPVDKKAEAPTVRNLFAHDVVWLLIPIATIYYVMMLSFSALKIYVQDLYDLQVVGETGLAVRFGATMAALTSGWIADKLNKKSTIGASFLVGAFGIMGVILSGPIGLLFFSATVGLFFGSGYPLLAAFLKERVSKESYQRAMGAFHVYRTFGMTMGFVVPLFLAGEWSLWSAVPLTLVSLGILMCPR